MSVRKDEVSDGAPGTTVPPVARRFEERFDELVIVWDHGIVSKDDYAALVTALGDLVRASGGAGLERRNGQPFDFGGLAGRVRR